MRLVKTFCGFATMVALAAPAAATPINVAQGATVSITGAVGVISCCWPDATTYPPASLASIVDGLFVPEGTEWQDGTVWWDAGNPGSANNIVEINLNGLFSISSLAIQADDNDLYGIYVRNELGEWYGLATALDVGGSGMRTRSGDFTPFLATAFRIDAFGGDGFYSLSEFQAIGEAVPTPEPGSLALLCTGGLGLIAAQRRRRQENS